MHFNSRPASELRYGPLHFQTILLLVHVTCFLFTPYFDAFLRGI